MLDSVSKNQPLSDGLRVNGRAQTGGGLTVNSVEAGQNTAGSRTPGAAENFKAAILSRAERLQKSGRTENTSPEAAQALADSLGQAAAEVRSVLGQNAANAFMGKVLAGLERNGFDLEGLTESVGSALRDVGQTASSKEMQQLTESFNRDLGAPADDQNGRATKGLSRAIGDFFGLEKTESAKGAAAAGFTKDGRWDQMAVADEETGAAYLKGTEESAELALAGSASFELGKMGSDVKDDLINFLRQELGAEEAAGYLENQGDRADCMSTMDTVINKTLEEVTDPAVAGKLESYLNDQVKTAVNAVVGTERNLFGQVEFEGWDFSRNATAIGENGRRIAGTTEYSSKWRYTNRDDVAYTRSGQAKPKIDDEEEAEEGSGSPLTDMIKKVSARTQGQTGELVDTTI